MTTVLVLRALGLGDTVTGLPALHVLRAACPRTRIVLATPARWTPLVRPFVDAVLDSRELEPLAPLDAPIDLAIDLHGNGARSRQLLTALEPRRILAYADRAVPWRTEEHDVERWVRLLRDGLPTRAAAPALGGILGPPPDAGMPTGCTVLHCGAKAAGRRWPAERFADLAASLVRDGHRVLVTAGPDERELAASIAGSARVEARSDLSLEQLMQLVGRARVVVAGDTGVGHLAAAYERPSVTLAGPVAPSRWGPPRHPRHRVVWHGDGTGDPHGTRLDPALARITVREAVTAVHRALSVAAHD